jgi:hypothetical protein
VAVSVIALPEPQAGAVGRSAGASRQFSTSATLNILQS